MNDKETEYFLKNEVGFSDEEIGKIAGLEPETKVVETTPAQVEVPVSTEQTPEAKTVVTEEKLFEDGDLLSDITLNQTPTEVVDDWKAKYEEINGKLTNIESNRFKKAFLELVDSPDFNFDTFLEAQSNRKTDYTKVPLGNLYKDSLKADTVAGYTEEDIEEMWEMKKDSLSPLEQKTLRSQLVKEMQSKESVVTHDEPQIFKEWKQTKEQYSQEVAKQQKEFTELNSGIETFANSLIGKKIAGVEITKDDIGNINKRMGLDYYKGEDGKLNAQKIALDQTKAIMFDKVVKYLKKEAVIEATKKITRPTTAGTSGQVVDTDGRSENEVLLDNAAKAIGLTSAADFKF